MSTLGTRLGFVSTFRDNDACCPGCVHLFVFRLLFLNLLFEPLILTCLIAQPQLGSCRNTQHMGNENIFTQADVGLLKMSNHTENVRTTVNCANRRTYASTGSSYVANSAGCSSCRSTRNLWSVNLATPLVAEGGCDNRCTACVA